METILEVLLVGGFASNVENYIDYVTYTTLGTVTDFGDFATSRQMQVAEGLTLE